MAVKTWTLDEPIAPADLNRMEQGLSKALAAGTTTGTNVNYVLTVDAFDLVDMSAVTVKFHVDNAAGATLNVNDTGAVPLFQSNGYPLPAGSVKAGGILKVAYNSALGRFYIIGGDSASKDIEIMYWMGAI